jgi:hypothetical protein
MAGLDQVKPGHDGEIGSPARSKVREIGETDTVLFDNLRRLKCN